MVRRIKQRVLALPCLRLAVCRAVLFPLGLTLILVGAGTGTACAADAKQLFFEGFELLKAGKAKAAAAKFEQGLKQEPNNAEAHFYLGEAYRARKQMSKARQQYEASLKADENSKVAEQARERLAVLTSAKEPGTAPAKSTGTPTMKEATQFIADYLMGCGEFRGKQIPGSPPNEDHLLSTRYWQWETFSLTGKQLRIEEWTRSTRYNTTKPEQGDYTISFTTRTTAMIDVSVLSPDVKVTQMQDDIWVAELVCSSGSCLEWEQALYFPTENFGIVSFQTAKSREPNKVDHKKGNKFYIEMCGEQEDATRISRALSHLITLGGGKKPLF